MLIMGFLFTGLWTESVHHLSFETGQSKASSTGRQMDLLLSESAQLAQTLSGQMLTKNVLGYLPGHVELDSMKNTLALTTLSREKQLSVHVIGANHAFSTSSLPEKYTWPVFSETDLFQQLNSMPHSSLFFCDPYQDEAGHNCILSVLTPVYDYHNNLVGYIIVDLFDTAFRDLLYRYGSDLGVSLWYDGKLIYSSEAKTLPHPDSLHQMKGYQALPEGGGSAEAENICFFWNSGDYNKLLRTFCQDISETQQIQNSALSLLFILLAVVGAFSVALAFLLSVKQSKPVVELLRGMDAVGKGRLDTRVEISGKGELAQLGERFNLLVEQLDQSTKATAKREAELRKQEITALQAQINPHFIYNTMGAARSLIRMGKPQEAGEIIGRLSTLLHANFRSIDSFITLEEDITLIRDYMFIQNLRFGNKFTLFVDLPPELASCRLPALILQPIVENAVKHGLEPSPNPGRVEVRAFEEHGDLILTVSDNGVGIDEEMERNLNSEHPQSDHVGYLNVRRRIELYCGEGYTATIHRLTDGTRVTLRLPMEMEEQNVSHFNR